MGVLIRRYLRGWKESVEFVQLSGPLILLPLSSPRCIVGIEGGGRGNGC